MKIILYIFFGLLISTASAGKFKLIRALLGLHSPINKGASFDGYADVEGYNLGGYQNFGYPGNYYEPTAYGYRSDLPFGISLNGNISPYNNYLNHVSPFSNGSV